MNKLFLILLFLVNELFAFGIQADGSQAQFESDKKQIESSVLQKAAVKQLRVPKPENEKGAEDSIESDLTLPQSEMLGFRPLLSLAEKEPELFRGLNVEEVYPFGVGVFRKLTLQLSRIPQQQRHVPANYVLGSGDQLRIHAWNESQDQTLSVEISQKGTIQFPLAGELFLRGVKKSDLNDYLKLRLSKYFKNLNVSSELTVLRQFPVYITGEVRLPGAYVATALSTPIQLLMASGGIQSNGSLREVQILRDDKLIGKVDLYDFLMSGRINEEVLFESGDVLHVPLAERNVAVLGKVRRPAIYELKGEEGFKDVIMMAGGFEADAVQGTLQRLTFDRMGRPSIEDLDYKSSISMKLNDGELIVVRGSAAVLDNKVQVLGNVFQEGYFQWTSGLTVKDLIEKADGLRADAFLPRAELLRKLDKPIGFEINSSLKSYTSTSVISINIADELAGAVVTELKSGDILRIFSLAEMQLSPKVEVIGAVEKSGEFILRAGETVRDVLFQAKISYSADMIRGEIHRPVTTGVQILEFDVGKALEQDLSNNLLLRNGDVISIFENPELKNLGKLTIKGEVKFPGVYPFKKGEYLGDILKRAGGLTTRAYLPAAKFYRESVRLRQRKTRDEYVEREQSELERVKIEAAQNSDQDQLSTNLEGLDTVSKALKSLENTDLKGRISLDMDSLQSLEDLLSHSSNIRLEDGDVFDIPEEPSEVTIIGQVYSPITVLFREGYRAEEYINLAGGLTDQAMQNKVYVIKASGAAIPINKRKRSGNFLSKYVSSVKVSASDFTHGGLQAGDSIVVPTRVGIKEDRFQKSLDQIYKLAISIGALGGLFK